MVNPDEEKVNGTLNNTGTYVDEMACKECGKVQWMECLKCGDYFCNCQNHGCRSIGFKRSY